MNSIFPSSGGLRKLRVNVSALVLTFSLVMFTIDIQKEEKVPTNEEENCLKFAC